MSVDLRVYMALAALQWDMVAPLQERQSTQGWLGKAVLHSPC